MVLVAAAGPATNLGLAVISALLFHIVPALPETMQLWAARNLSNSMVLNIVLAVFNMLSLPPLDGGRVPVGLLPNALARLERHGFFIIIALIFVLPAVGRYAGVDLNIFVWIVMEPVNFLVKTIAVLTGAR